MEHAMSRRLFVGGTIASGALTLVACQTPASPPEPSSETGPTPAATSVEGFTMAVSGVIAGLDPLLMNTSEQTLLCRQIFQRLVGVDPNTGTPTPTEIATDWQVSNDGLEYVFTLAPNLTFHDGTDCDAEAVVQNIERWSQLPTLVENFDELLLPDHFADVFGSSIHDSDEGRGAFLKVEATGNTTVVISLRTPVTSMLAALAHTAFGICSPAALKSKAANNLNKKIHGMPVSQFGLEPVGSGPYTAEHHTDSVTLREFSENVLPSPEASQNSRSQATDPPQKANMVCIKQDFARLRLLEQGEISAMADLTPDQLQPVMQQGLRFLQRDPFGMAYLGINHEHQLLRSSELRSLLATTLDRNHLAGSYFISGTNATQAFTPPALSVPADAVPLTTLDTATAIERLEELIEEDSEFGKPIPLYFPTDAARTWLPLPERTAMNIASQYANIGIKIRPVPIAWNQDYLRRVHQDSNVGLYLWGHVGAYRDALDFLSPIVNGKGPAREFNHIRASRLIEEARHEPDRSTRQQIFGEVTEILTESIAAIPLCAPLSALALAQEVMRYPTSPVLDEPFNEIRINVRTNGT